MARTLILCIPALVTRVCFTCRVCAFKLLYQHWGNTAKVHKEEIFKIQKRLVRILFKKPQNEHYSPLFKKARILPIDELYQLMINFTNILKSQLLNITLTNLSIVCLFHLPHPRVVTAKFCIKLLSSGIVSQKISGR